MKKILFVDDEADLLKVLSMRLKKGGYEVFAAVDGPEALEMAFSKTPDLIILDVYLPGMNGDDVATILKKDEKTKTIPIILISADATTLEARFKKCGADGFLPKPIESKDLESMVEEHILSGK